MKVRTYVLEGLNISRNVIKLCIVLRKSSLKAKALSHCNSRDNVMVATFLLSET